MFVSILPSNATALQIALEATTANRFDILSDEITNLKTLHDPALCPPAFLPLLAYHNGVDFWSSLWSESVKRDVIARSFYFKQRKGTPWSLVEIVRLLGYGTARVFTDADKSRYGDGTKYGGGAIYTPPMQWFEYELKLEKPITQVQADSLKSYLERVAPLTRRLRRIYFDVSLAYGDGKKYGEGYTYGDIR